MKVAAIQFDVALGDPESNRLSVRRLVEAAVSSEGPDLVVLPEMWNTGYCLSRVRDVADRDGEPTRGFISELCRRYRMNIIAGSVADLREGRVYNTSYVFGRDGGELGQYSKIHRFRLMHEHLYLEAGDRPLVVDIDGVRCGVMICYDLRFPELARRIALAGASAMFIPAQWPHPREHHWRTLLMARAIENQMYVVGCNRVGLMGDEDFFGRSMIVDPWGEIAVEAGATETVISADIDVDRVRRVRETIPVFEDRNPESYERL